MPPTPPPPPRAAAGRPRSETARRAVLDAARTLFDKGGLPAATVEAIAAKAGVAKTTVYRWWPNRASLLVDVLVDLASDLAPPPAGDDPLHALRTEMRLAGGAVNGITGRLLAALLGESQSDADTREAVLALLIKPRNDASALMVRQAQANGAIRSDVPAHVVVDMLWGALFYRLMTQHAPVTERFMAQVFDEVMEGVKPRAKGRR